MRALSLESSASTNANPSAPLKLFKKNLPVPPSYNPILTAPDVAFALITVAIPLETKRPYPLGFIPTPTSPAESMRSLSVIEPPVSFVEKVILPSSFALVCVEPAI